MRLKMSVVLISMITVVVASCSHNRSRVVSKRPASENAQEIASGQAESSPRSLVSAIDFIPGRKALSPEATAEINRLLIEAKQVGQVHEVSIAVWSDVEAPEGQGQKIPRSQVDLAEERADNIEKYIDRMEPQADLKVHNMAEESSGFVNYLQAQDETVKSQLATVGVATDEVNDEIKGRSSSALVLIKVK